MSNKLEIVRQSGEDGSRWILIFGRNKDGTIRNQQEITEVLETAFSEALCKARDEFYATVQQREKQIEDLRLEVRSLEEIVQKKMDNHYDEMNRLKAVHHAELEAREVELRSQHVDEQATLRQNARRIIDARETECAELIQERTGLQSRLGCMDRAFHIDEAILAKVYQETYRDEAIAEGKHHPSTQPWWHRIWRFRCCDPWVGGWEELTDAQRQTVMIGVRAVRYRIAREAALLQQQGESLDE